MRSREHLYFDSPASAGDRYFGIGVVATQYAVQMMAPGRIIGFRCYASTAGEQAIVMNTAPVNFASGDRISVYISYAPIATVIAVYLNGGYYGAFSTTLTMDKRNQNYNATVLVEYF